MSVRQGNKSYPHLLTMCVGRFYVGPIHTSNFETLTTHRHPGQHPMEEIPVAGCDQLLFNYHVLPWRTTWCPDDRE